MMATPPILNPFQIIFQEHAKYMVAIKELQNQVQVLHQFRNRVLQAFPQLESGIPYGVMPAKMAPQSAGNLTTVASPRKPGVISKGGRILPSVQKVAPSAVSRHTAVKPQPFVGQQSRSPVTSATSRIRRSDRGNWESKKFVVVAQGKNWMRIRPCAKKSDSEMDDSDDATSDSFHSMEPQEKRKTKSGRSMGPRQDSGFSTDGKERHQQERSSDGRWLKVSSSNEDELMNVLDQIGQKSQVLRTQVDRAEMTAASHGPTLSDIGLKPDDILSELERLRVEKEQIQERLVMAEAEREMYKGEMIRIRDSLIDSEAARRGLEERLDVFFNERDWLVSRTHNVNTQFSRSNERDSPASKREVKDVPTKGAGKVNGSEPPLFTGSASLPDRLGQTKLKVHLDKSKISAILSESSTVELQRQLLEAMLRNEVLKTQMDNSLAEWKSRLSAWQQSEEVLQSDAELLRQSSNDLQGKLQQAETELRVERSKRQVLERALQAAYKDLTSANSRGESVASTENVRQLSEELFPVHQITVNNSSGKFSGRNSPQTWKPPITPVSSAHLFTPQTAAVTTDYHNLNKTQFEFQDSPQQAIIKDQSNKLDYGDASRRRNGNTDDEDAITNMCLHLRPTLEGRLSTHDARRKTIIEINGTNKPETNSKPNSYLMNGHSPKSRAAISSPKFSQSAEDVRHSEWDWTYEIRKANQRLVNIPQRMVMPEAAT